MSQHGYSPPSNVDSNGPPTEGDGIIELLIETLTGNAFGMTISPSDTIAVLKSKIHRVEGIPVSAQHLLFNLIELEDNSKVSDCAISNGSTLRLVTSMRGGPISTRRVSPTPEERAWMDLVDSNRCDDLLQRIPSGQLTVLVFCEGEQFNLFRVVENADGTYSPVQDSANASSTRNALSSDEPDATAQRLRENTVTMGKMKELQQKLSSGMSRRKTKISGSQETTSTGTTPLENHSSTQTDTKASTAQWKSQLALQLASQSDSRSSKIPSEQASSPSRSPQSLSKRSISCPHRKLTLPRLETSHLSQVKVHQPTVPIPSRPFLPVMSVPRRAKQESTRSSSSSSSQGQSIRIPAPPRLIAPPLHIPPLLQRPPPLRPMWNQRPGPVVIPELNSCPAPMPKIHSLIKDDSVQYVPAQSVSSRVPAMCQSRRRLDPIVPQRELIPNLHSGIQPQMHVPTSSQSDTQSGAGPGAAVHLVPMAAPGVQKRNNLMNVSNCVFVPNTVVVPQPTPPMRSACHFVLLRGPTTSPEERFTEYLTAYLTQSFSRFSGMIPENLPVCLSHKLTKRLSHHFVGGLSDVAVNQLSLQLSNYICQFLEECLSNRCPKDVSRQALRTILEERTAQGYPISGDCRQADLWDPHMRVGVRRLPTFSADVGTNYVHSPEPARDNMRETRELFSQIPRFHSAPTPLTSQGSGVRHSGFTGLHREPLYVRLNDSSMYQRGMVPVLVRPATSPKFPPPIFCNTVQAGPPSMEVLRRIIESSVPQLRQPRLQTEIPRDQSQVQVTNGVGRLAMPFRSPPPFSDPSQQPVFAGYQAPRVRWRTVRYSLHPNSPPRLQTVPGQSETQTGNDNGQGQGDNLSSETCASKLPKKSNQRCCQCRKKLTISNKYLCRCQKLFCSTHRYSEAHNCNFDYKEEGRKLLLQENPLVMAEKIVKM